MSLGPGAEFYAPLINSGIASVVGFEPVKEECDKLNSTAGPNRRFLPFAVGDGTTRTFHLCNRAMTSSLYEPNTGLLEHFHEIADLTRVVERSKLKTYRLDDLPEAADPDFIKLDVQGAELDVIHGAPLALAQTMVLETEVEFIPMYKDQPLFAHVDQELRRRGFMFHRFAGFAGRGFKPVVMKFLNRLPSQWMWSNAIYIKSFMDFARLPPAKLLKLAIVVHAIYGSVDLAALALKSYDLLAGTSLQPAYLQRLQNRPA